VSPAIGERLPSRTREVTAAEVAAFAALTGDDHPLHQDSETARESGWGEPVAPGLLVLCFSVGLVDLDPARVSALRGLRDVDFVKATRFGETISVDAEVTSTRPIRPGLELLGLRWVVRDAAGNALVRARLELLWDAS
jgi:3-hydroxybutyryl-CoA dehydratase